MINKFVSPNRSKLDIVQEKEIVKLMESLASGGSLHKQNPLGSTFTSNPMRTKHTNPISEYDREILEIELQEPLSLNGLFPNQDHEGGITLKKETSEYGESECDPNHVTKLDSKLNIEDANKSSLPNKTRKPRNFALTSEQIIKNLKRASEMRIGDQTPQKTRVFTPIMIDHGHYQYLKNKRNTDFMTAVDRIENECVNLPTNEKSQGMSSQEINKVVIPVRKAIMMKRSKESP
jgi:hypothetical protein